MPTQTPASRRFRPPPSTASAPSQRNPTFSTSQFVRPSQTSSSPYARTPFPSTAQKQRKDEIVANESLSEDDEHDSDHVVPTKTGELFERPVRISARDTEEDDLIDDQTSYTPLRPTQYTQSNDLIDTRISSTKRRKISHSISEIIDDDHDLDLPSPPSSPTQSQIDIQSRPEVDVPHTSPENTHFEADDNTINPIETNRSTSPTSSPPPSSLHNLRTPKHKPPRSRFLDTHTQPNQPSTTPSQIYPSFQSRLLASTSTTTDHHPTSNSPNLHLRGPRPNFDLTLPDAFSPSRKRGNREYIHGGLAETVRGWVVDMATRVAGGGIGAEVGVVTGSHRVAMDAETTQSGTSEKKKVDEKNTMTVSEVLLNDLNGRFTLVRSKATRPMPNLTVANNEDKREPEDIFQNNDTDTNGLPQTWLLLNTDPQRKPGIPHSSTSSSELNSVVPGRTVIVKGGDSMTWDLKLGFDPYLSTNVDLESDGNEGLTPNEIRKSRCNVAVLWDVK